MPHFQCSTLWTTIQGLRRLAPGYHLSRRWRWAVAPLALGVAPLALGVAPLALGDLSRRWRQATVARLALGLGNTAIWLTHRDPVA